MVDFDKEEIQSLYWDEGYSTREIANLKGVVASTVIRFMKIHRIPRRTVSHAMCVMNKKIDEGWLAYTPRIINILNRGRVGFKIERTKSHIEDAISEEKELDKIGITSHIYIRKSIGSASGFSYSICINDIDNILKFLDLVDDYKNGKAWKQICARKIRQLAIMRSSWSRKKQTPRN